MLTTRTAAIVVAVATLALAGCQSSRMSSLDTQPAPLPPAPSGKVTNQDLPPPAAATQTPPAETQTQVASAEPPANAPDVTVNTVTGVWKASVGGQSCQLATSLTKYGSNNRAAALRCPAPLDSVKAWNVSGKQLTLFDDGGSPLARLYSTGAEKFSGQTTTGTAISLSR